MIRLRSFQVALFSNLIIPDNKLEFVSKLISTSNNIFNGDPVILPIPNDAPPEIPRIIVKSKDERLVCNVSMNRLDLFFNPKSETDALLDNIHDNFFGQIIKIINFLNEIYHIKIFRVGIVANLILNLKESSNIFIARKYLKDSNLISDTFELQLHALNKITLLNKYKANRWLRIMTSRDIQNQNNDKFLLVSIDINTLPDVSYDFDRELLTLVFKNAVEDMQKLIKIHYSEVDNV